MVRSQYEKDDGTKVDNPRVITREYGLTLHKKATLRKDLVAARGRDFTDAELAGFDLFTILGVPFEIQVVHKTKGDKTYSNVGAVSKPFAGVEIPAAELVSSTGEVQGQMLGLPDWIADKITDAKEFKALQDRENIGTNQVYDGQVGHPPDDEDIPF